MGAELDEIGVWSEIKLAILKEYAAAYSRILSSQSRPRLDHVYIDAFAGWGRHVSKETGEFVLGSPLNALAIKPPFTKYFLIDLDGDKIEALRKEVGARKDVQFFTGDCNRVLHEEVFPSVKYEDFRRGLCLLDPYGLHIEWSVLKKAGEMRTLDVFLNFPMMDMNRNVLWHDTGGVSDEDVARMTAFWGDDSWRSAAYSTEQTLFGESYLSKSTNESVVEAFRTRLKREGSFAYVPSPIPMRNSHGAVVYYLFFASQKSVATGIVEEIFAKYRAVGLRR